MKSPELDLLSLTLLFSIFLKKFPTALKSNCLLKVQGIACWFFHGHRAKAIYSFLKYITSCNKMRSTPKAHLVCKCNKTAWAWKETPLQKCQTSTAHLFSLPATTGLRTISTYCINSFAELGLYCGDVRLIGKVIWWCWM